MLPWLWAVVATLHTHCCRSNDNTDCMDSSSDDIPEDAVVVAAAYRQIGIVAGKWHNVDAAAAAAVAVAHGAVAVGMAEAFEFVGRLRVHLHCRLMIVRCCFAVQLTQDC